MLAKTEKRCPPLPPVRYTYRASRLQEAAKREVDTAQEHRRRKDKARERMKTLSKKKKEQSEREKMEREQQDRQSQASDAW